jgi:hypothetical protein
MLTLVRALTLVMMLLATANARRPCESLEDVYTDASGRQSCGRHRIPLITVQGFAMRDRSTIMDPATDAEGDLQRCNPNFIADYFSLRRTKLVSEPHKITYCRECEAAVHAWRLRHYPGYSRQDSGGSYIRKL